MKLQLKRAQSHRGVIGVESAIVMIAFVIVAAALAFVVLNMGFSTSQKAKTTILSSLAEASSSMQVAGKVIGSGDIYTSSLNATSFPFKIASGGSMVNLEAKVTAVKLVANNYSYDDVYVGTLTGEYKSLMAAVAQAYLLPTSGYEEFGDIDQDPFDNSVGLNPSNTRAFIYWAQERNSNDLLEEGETAILAIVYGMNEKPVSLDKIKVEIITSAGASLTVERQVPSIATTVIDLG